MNYAQVVNQIIRQGHPYQNAGRVGISLEGTGRVELYTSYDVKGQVWLFLDFSTQTQLTGKLAQTAKHAIMSSCGLDLD